MTLAHKSLIRPSVGPRDRSMDGQKHRLLGLQKQGSANQHVSSKSINSKTQMKLPQQRERENSLPGPLMNMKNSNLDSSPAFQFKGPTAIQNNCNISSQGSGKEMNQAIDDINQHENRPKDGDHYWSNQNNNISLRQEKDKETISGPSSSVGGQS